MDWLIVLLAAPLVVMIYLMILMAFWNIWTTFNSERSWNKFKKRIKE